MYSLAGCFFALLYYLPLYFQSVDNVSASNSGVRNLPLVVGASLFTIISGGLIAKTGHYWPILLVGSVLATIGSGLIYTLDIGTSTGKWIGYQLLVGAGCGVSSQIWRRPLWSSSRHVSWVCWGPPEQIANDL